MKRPRSIPSGATAWVPDEIRAIKDQKLLPIADSTAASCIPRTPQQWSSAIFRAGRICDYITDKWGWDTMLAMLHDFGASDDTAAVIRKELKMEPAEFDKQFLADRGSRHARDGRQFRRVEEIGIKELSTRLAEERRTNDAGVIRAGQENALRSIPDYVEAGSVYEFAGGHATWRRATSPPSTELERYAHAGGRRSRTIKLLAKQGSEAGRQQEGSRGDALERLNYIYPMDPEQHRMLGKLWRPGQRRRHPRIPGVLARKPIDPAQAHFDLARAFNRESPVRDQAKERSARRARNRARFPPGAKATAGIERRRSQRAAAKK
jgi:hypothetical protein